MNERHSNLPADPLWYKDAIIYELRVRSFYDSSGDGIGDLPGLTSKLDYLKDLGVTALWLLPFYPSPLRDDGYDISDYMDVHPDCGTLRDFKVFLREAHRRGLRVITELVINHTSDQHPWFQKARRAAKGDPARDFYVWSDHGDSYRDARIIFQDFETSNWAWDPVAHAYYWHRFYSHQPDLNFDNPAVRRAIYKVLDFWMGMGVDGLRLDAVPYLYEREGTNCENLPETHQFLRELRRHIDDKFADRMLLAEANQWPEDAVTYLAEGKECHMAFHFPLMPRIFISVRMENRFPLNDIWAQTPPIDPTCQWALFLRNHDELTLEMVTDEERDYMYRAYANEPRMRINLGIRRRLAPLLGNNRRSIELLNGLLLSMPGTPVIYYGDEIGMGDNIYLGDRDGVRTPMQWSGDRNAGFSQGDPQRLILPVTIDHEYHYQTVNVDAQQRNRHSMLWWMRRLIALRKQYKAFGRGSMEMLNPANSRVLAFIRSYENERLLVICNLSRYVQYVELDLGRFKGMSPVELFGRTPFPTIGDLPYLLTLGPHMFAWFSLESADAKSAAGGPQYQVPLIEMTSSLDHFLRSDNREQLERALPAYLPLCRWFRGKAHAIRSCRVADIIPLHEENGGLSLALIDVELADTEPETYLLPLAIARHQAAGAVRQNFPRSILANVELTGRNGAETGVLYDATSDPQFAGLMLETIARKRHHRGGAGLLAGDLISGFASVPLNDHLEPRALAVEQSNSSIAFGDKYILKFFRRLESGISPDLELGRFLTERASFAHTPALAGWLEYRAGRDEPRTMAVLQRFVPNQGDAWAYATNELDRYFERASVQQSAPPFPSPSIADLASSDGPDPVSSRMIGAFLEAARLLGRRVAELHLSLATPTEDPNFAPEAFSPFWHRSVYQSLRNLANQNLRILHAQLGSLAAGDQARAERLLAHPEWIDQRFDAFLRQPLSSMRIRCHGDLHLGQVLYTGNDFFIIDFEGEPARPLGERRRKRSAMRDVAGMIRSFDYAASGTLLEMVRSGALAGQDFASMRHWAVLWQRWASALFLKEYLQVAANAPFIPADRDELRVLLDAFILEKAIYELGYELNNRPGWVGIPLRGIEFVLGVDLDHT
jgi:maltose alpha-D-glucosyltransferase / alpha-amylase